ncbi:hypothetical protein SBRY_40198 [Actinacidiphila bryophytorum]|uniref:Uncharacterized protein n=1 Tax=Actinacidiphila bryophytorum TaxID=1436133 RepID=A0A9W4H2H0_9ACTN|nr:hypothetical protein SBRY_40198 [Actinacidiphila bryophytorum]
MPPGNAGRTPCVDHGDGQENDNDDGKRWTHGPQRTAPGREAPLHRRHRSHLRDPQEPPQRPGPADAAQVRPRRPQARALPRGALTQRTPAATRRNVRPVPHPPRKDPHEERHPPHVPSGGLPRPGR